jgi:cell division protein FtsW
MFKSLSQHTLRRAHAPDYLVLLCVGLLALFGLFILASASSSLGAVQFGDSYYYLKHQIYYGLSFGVVGFLITSKLFYGVLSKRGVSLTLLVLSICGLGLVFTPLGLTLKGATRWVEIGPISFQPADLLKLSLIIYLASWLAFKDHRQQSIKQGLLPFGAVLTVISTFLILQHSTSPVAMLILVALVMYFVSGARVRYLVTIIGAGILSLALVVAVTPYRAQRVLTYLNPEADASGSGPGLGMDSLLLNQDCPKRSATLFLLWRLRSSVL